MKSKSELSSVQHGSILLRSVGDGEVWVCGVITLQDNIDLPFEGAAFPFQINARQPSYVGLETIDKEMPGELSEYQGLFTLSDLLRNKIWYQWADRDEVISIRVIKPFTNQNRTIAFFGAAKSEYLLDFIDETEHGLFDVSNRGLTRRSHPQNPRGMAASQFFRDWAIWPDENQTRFAISGKTEGLDRFYLRKSQLLVAAARNEISLEQADELLLGETGVDLRLLYGLGAPSQVDKDYLRYLGVMYKDRNPVSARTATAEDILESDRRAREAIEASMNWDGCETALDGVGKGV